MVPKPIRRNPDTFTAYLANGGNLNGNESAWVQTNLQQLRAATPGSPAQHGLSLAALKHIYTGARVIQGSVVASRIALPTLVEAGEAVPAASLRTHLPSFTNLAATEMDRFLTGRENGKPREGHDYPEIVTQHIAALADVLVAGYRRASENLQAGRPDLLAIAWDADELNRLSWGHIRWRINDLVSAPEVATYRTRPLREGSEELLAAIKQRTGVTLPLSGHATRQLGAMRCSILANQSRWLSSRR